MHRVVITGQAKDSQKWLEKFPARAHLSKKGTSRATHYTINDDNRFAIYHEVEDLDTYFEVLKSSATADSMAEDGVVPDSVNVFVLDKQR